MKLVIIFGAPAVGKMTVGQELMKITDLRLYHNHMTIDPIAEVFGQRCVSAEIRVEEVVCEEFAKSDLGGMIYTIAKSLSGEPSDWSHLEHLSDIFKRNGAEIYFVELVATLEVRLQRNVTENRLLNKPCKRDVAGTTARLHELDKKSRLVSYDGEVPFDNYMKIDNTNLPPDTVAKMIADRFLF
ncbi:MAG: AAA family ATPase [Defluviitaleaceae bacterium]|nr:AAA family ATPase [Defluviitaleaceae bacterium]